MGELYALQHRLHDREPYQVHAQALAGVGVEEVQGVVLGFEVWFGFVVCA